jgi:hypothetical protein
MTVKRSLLAKAKGVRERNRQSTEYTTVWIRVIRHPAVNPNVSYAL